MLESREMGPYLSSYAFLGPPHSAILVWYGHCDFCLFSFYFVFDVMFVLKIKISTC